MPLLRGMQPWTVMQALSAGIRSLPKPKHVFYCVADHFEPDWHGASRQVQDARVQRWVEDYPSLFGTYVDSRGKGPQHSFFYPIEVYDARHIEQLCRLVRDGHGDVEIHLHHDNDCSENLRETLDVGRRTLHNRHGLLSKNEQGEIQFGFIHGNWALDNSHPDGRWCGVNDELTVLREMGCYADFTMPAAPHPAQTRTINSIYYAIDDPVHCKSHDVGIPAIAGKSPPEKGLLMIQGPLSIGFDRRGWRPKVTLENGNLAGSQPPSPHRIARWLKAYVHVAKQPEWLFVKLHTHGAQEENARVLLGEPMCRLHEAIKNHAHRHSYQFYYVTAREMANLVGQAETGAENPTFLSGGRS